MKPMVSVRQDPGGKVITFGGLVSTGRRRGYRYVNTRTFGPKLQEQAWIDSGIRRFYLSITADNVSILELPRTNAVFEVQWLDLAYLILLLLAAIILFQAIN